MIGILDVKARAVSIVVAAGTTAATTALQTAVATFGLTTVTTISAFALQEASKVFEFLEFGIWEILSV